MGEMNEDCDSVTPTPHATHPKLNFFASHLSVPIRPNLGVLSG